MKFTPQDPPRTFSVGTPASPGGIVRMKDCGRVDLRPDEQVTLTTPSGTEYDVARKSWGFYATPSLNSRLPRFGLRAVLVKCPEAGNPVAKYFIYLVERGREAEFEQYNSIRGYGVVAWLDRSEALEELDRKVNGPRP